MFTIGSIHADQALRLANERQAGFRREVQQERLRAARPGSSGLDRIRGGIGRISAAFREVETNPLPRLLEYSYRP
jgi:hypothetical protein